MPKKEVIKHEDGSKTVVGPIDDSLLGRMKDGLFGLVEKVFCDTHKFDVTVGVTITPEGYEYDIDYGNAGLPLEQIAEIQNLARSAADEFISADPERRGAEVEYVFYHRSFDPFGLRRRLWRYLAN